MARRHRRRVRSRASQRRPSIRSAAKGIGPSDRHSASTGGADGRGRRGRLRRGDGRRRARRRPTRCWRLGPARLTMTSPGGGGFGDPLDRDPALRCLRDVRDEVVSRARSRRRVRRRDRIDAPTTASVDRRRATRARMRCARRHAPCRHASAMNRRLRELGWRLHPAGRAARRSGTSSPTSCSCSIRSMLPSPTGRGPRTSSGWSTNGELLTQHRRQPRAHLLRELRGARARRAAGTGDGALSAGRATVRRTARACSGRSRRSRGCRCRSCGWASARCRSCSSRFSRRSSPC